MEVVLSQSPAEDPWSCIVRLRIMFNSEGYALETPRVITYGERLFDPAHVERTLVRAQDTILRSDEWVDGMDPDQDRPPRQSFSRNVVRLEVSAPELVDVTFIDLPGIVTNAKEVHFQHGLMIRNI
jgi:hypothetical protein